MKKPLRLLVEILNQQDLLYRLQENAPDLVGKPFPYDKKENLGNAFANADLAIVLGSSLVVNPAASLPYISARNGKDIVIVNRQRTYIDDYAAIRYDDLEEFFSAFSDYLVSHEGK